MERLAHADSLLQQGRAREALADYQRALGADRDDAYANRQVGVAYLELGELTRAYHFLLRARSQDPTDSDTRLALGRVYLVEARPNEVREQARAVLEKDSASVPALMMLASVASNAAEAAALTKKFEAARPHFTNHRPGLSLAALYLRRSDTLAAEKLLNEIAANDPGSAEVHAVLSSFYSSRRDAARAEQESKAASGLAPIGSPIRRELANVHLLLGNRGEAERILQEIVEQAPDDVIAHRLLVELALADGASSKVTPWLASILAKDNNDVDALVQRGRQRLAMGQTADAFQDLSAALRADSALAPTYYQLGLAEIQKANKGEGKAAIDSGMAAAERNLENASRLAPGYPEAVLQLAELRIQGGVAKKAIGDLDHFISENPNSLRAQSILGAALLASRRVAEGVEAYRKMLEIDPTDAEGHYRFGLGLAAQGRTDEALDEFESAVSLAPAYADPLSQIVLTALANGKADAALTRVQKQIEAVPQSAPLHDLLGLVRLARNEQDLAEAAFLKSVELDPGLVDARVRLAELYNASGRFDQAVAQAEAATALETRNVRALMALGAAYQQKRDVAAARRIYESVLRGNPRMVDAANNLAVLLSDQPGSQDEALRYARFAQDVAPNDPHVADTLGWILYRRKEYARALELIKQSAEKLPESSTIQYHLGIVARQLGDTSTAREALTKAVSSTMPFAGQDEARKALEAMK